MLTARTANICPHLLLNIQFNDSWKCHSKEEWKHNLSEVKVVGKNQKTWKTRLWLTVPSLARTVKPIFSRCLPTCGRDERVQRTQSSSFQTFGSLGEDSVFSTLYKWDCFSMDTTKVTSSCKEIFAAACRWTTGLFFIKWCSMCPALLQDPFGNLLPDTTGNVYDWQMVNV
jgi:hypothetical protein